MSADHGHHGAVESSGKTSGGYIKEVADLVVDFPKMMEKSADMASKVGAGPDTIQSAIGGMVEVFTGGQAGSGEGKSSGGGEHH